jgi:phosphate starvation-inducible PhoH-like protein
MVIATGAPGSGKTHLAVVEAAGALVRGETQRLVLTRPAVSAGESLGFLPGTADEKLDPYMRPMMDALNCVFTKREIKALREDGRLEMAPIAYMRGRTFHKAWVLFDEAQNCTPAQMRMVLTRLGVDSKMVVTGDLDQCDVPGVSGLADLLIRLPPVRGRDTTIRHVNMTSADVQRSDAVKEVLRLYKLN